MVIWKYVLPDDQLEMRVNGCVTNNSYSFIFHRYISIKVIYYEYETEFHFPSHCSYQSKFFEILSDYLGAFFFWFVGHLNEKCVGILRHYNESLFFGNSQLNLLVQFFCCKQTYLCLWVDQTDAVLVDGDEQLLREIGLGRLFHFKEGRPKGRPIVDYL